MSKLFILAAPLLASCASYDPPVAADHHSVKYQADLAKCHAQAAKRANQQANATPSSAIRALFASDRPEHDDETTCMIGRGYAREPGSLHSSQPPLTE